MKLSYGQTFLLGFGFLGVSAIWSVYNAFVPVFLSEKFHLSPALIAFFLSLDNAAALLIQPPAGAWSDRIRTRIGRRMPFVLIGAPVAAGAFALMPVAPVLPLFVLCTSTLLVSMALWRTPVMALVADVTPSPLRSQASGVISLMGGVGGIIAYFGGAALGDRNAAYPFWLGAVVVLVAALLLVVGVKEPRIHENSENNAAVLEAAPPGFFDTLGELLAPSNPGARALLGALFLLMVGYTAVEGFFSLYALHHLGMSAAQSSRLLGQISLVFVLFAVPSGNLAARFDRRAIVLSGLLLMSALLVLIYFLPVPLLQRVLLTLPILGDVPVLGALLMVVGIAWALIIIHPLPMLSDLADENRLGTYTGMYYLFTSLAAIAGPNLNGWVVAASGNNYNTVMLFAPVCLLMAGALLWRAQPSAPTRAVELQKPIAQAI